MPALTENLSAYVEECALYNKSCTEMPAHSKKMHAADMKYQLDFRRSVHSSISDSGSSQPYLYKKDGK